MNTAMFADRRFRCMGLFAVGLVLAVSVRAQSLSIEAGADVLGGGSPAIVKPRFQAGASAVSRYRMVFSYPAAAFASVNATQCLANAACTVDAALGQVVIERTSVAPAALTDEVACLLEFDGGGVLGVYPLQMVSAQFFDAVEQPVAGTSTGGTLGVVSAGGLPPALSYGPAPDPSCASNSSDEVVFDDAPAPTFASVDVTAVVSPAPSAVSLTCSVSTGFLLISGGEQSISFTAPAMPIMLRCDVPTAARGVLTCTENSVSGSRPRSWDLACKRPLFADGMESVAP